MKFFLAAPPIRHTLLGWVVGYIHVLISIGTCNVACLIGRPGKVWAITCMFRYHINPQDMTNAKDLCLGDGLCGLHLGNHLFYASHIRNRLETTGVGTTVKSWE